MQNIDLSKISSWMTPKERAKLFIALELKDMGNALADQKYSFSSSTCEALHRVWSSCPEKEQEQFNSLVVLKTFIWNVAVFDIASKLTYLQILVISGKHSSRIWRLIEELQNFAALVEAIEEKYFDGAEILSRDPKSSMGTMGWIISIVELVADKFDIDPLPEIDEAWVERHLAFAEEAIIDR